MKRLKSLVGVLVAAAALCMLSAPMAPAQKLDDVWFKQKVSFKGYSRDPVTGDYRTLNLSFTAYMHFVWNSVNEGYEFAGWTNPFGDWSQTSGGYWYPCGPQENFMENCFQFILPSGHNLTALHYPFISYSGSKVTYKGTGAAYSKYEPDFQYYGYVNISGTSVDPSKLPFTP